MIPSDFDWTYVRRHTLIPFICLLASAAAVVAAHVLKQQQLELNEQITANQVVVQEDYASLVQRRRIVDRYHRRYQQFAALGFVGMESRLDWVETLRMSSGVLTLPRVSYIIEPQLNAIAPVQSILAGDDISIHVSRLDLEMSLVHELDLLRFVDELQQNAPGLIKVDRCELLWQADPQQALIPDVNIGANCTLSIYSVITADVPPGGAT